MDWEKLVGERNEWVAHNFPNPHVPNPGESILGVMEEVGELAHAYLKSAQNIRGDREQHEAKAKDAIADTTIYLLGVMNIYGLPNTAHPVVISSKNTFEALMVLGKSLGELCGTSADLPDIYPIEKTIAICEDICMQSDWDFEEVVLKTWEKVKSRDWAAYPDTGFPPENISAEALESRESSGGSDRVNL